MGGIVVDALAEVDLVMRLVGGLGGGLLIDHVAAVLFGNGHATHALIQGQNITEHAGAIHVKGHGYGGAPIHPFKRGMLTAPVDHQQRSYTGFLNGGLHTVGLHIRDIIDSDQMNGRMELVGIGVENAIHDHGGSVRGIGLDSLDFLHLHRFSVLTAHQVQAKGVQNTLVVRDVLQVYGIGTHLTGDHLEGNVLLGVDAVVGACTQPELCRSGGLRLHGDQNGIICIGIHIIFAGEGNIRILVGRHGDDQGARLIVLLGRSIVAAQTLEALQHIHGLCRLIHLERRNKALAVNVGLVEVSTVAEDIHVGDIHGILGIEAPVGSLHVGGHGIPQVGDAVLVDHGGDLAVPFLSHVMGNGHGLVGHDEGLATAVGVVALNVVGHAARKGDAGGVGAGQGGDILCGGLTHGLTDVALLEGQPVAVGDQVGGQASERLGHTRLTVGTDEELFSDGGHVVAQDAHLKEILGQLGVAVGIAHHDLLGTRLSSGVHRGGDRHTQLCQRGHQAIGGLHLPGGGIIGDNDGIFRLPVGSQKNRIFKGIGSLRLGLDGESARVGSSRSLGCTGRAPAPCQGCRNQHEKCQDHGGDANKIVFHGIRNPFICCLDGLKERMLAGETGNHTRSGHKTLQNSIVFIQFALDDSLPGFCGSGDRITISGKERAKIVSNLTVRENIGAGGGKIEIQGIEDQIQYLVRLGILHVSLGQHRLIIRGTNQSVTVVCHSLQHSRAHFLSGFITDDSGNTK